MSCSEEYKKILPQDVTIVAYENIPKQGSIDHAYNMHTLLNHITTDWFCIMDPDVYPIAKGWDEKILPLIEGYDVFGIPYSSPNRFYDFPMVHLLFFKHASFIEEIDKNNLRDNDKWNIFMPLTKESSINSIINRTPFHKLVSRPEELTSNILLPNKDALTKRHLSQYNKRYKVNGKLPCPDTCWRMPIIFKDLKVFCFKESEIDKNDLDPKAGRGIRQSYKYANLAGEDIFVHLVYAANA